MRAPGVTSVWVERYLREVRPDISFVLNGERVAIEIQISMLSRDGIDWRTTAYAKKDIAVLWMPLLSSEVFADRYAPKDWERYLHTLYFGKVYYWAEHTCSRHPIRLLALRRGKKDCEEAPCSQVKRGFLNALAKHVSELEGTAKAVLFVPVSHLFPATGGGQYVYRMS